MTEVGTVYGEALYQLAKEEGLSQNISRELDILKECFQQEPEFIRLLGAPNLSKQERCGILDNSFRGKIHIYVLNFLKILTQKGYMRHFSDCCDAYMDRYCEDNDILQVTVHTAVAMSESQAQRLREKLGGITGKHILLHSRVDPDTLGGVRLDYDGKRLDDTVAQRLQRIRELLDNTVL